MTPSTRAAAVPKAAEEHLKPVTRLRVRSVEQIAFWTAGACVGVAAVLVAKLVTTIQEAYFLAFAAHPWLVTAATPILFFLAAALVVQIAPEATGSGIPQVLEAIEAARKNTSELGPWASRLVSIPTALMKVISMAVGLIGGASLGREGPTVQIASSTFAWAGKHARRYAPQLTLQPLLTAGAAAGVAAAFNTPLAGVTFAIEEIAEDAFGKFKNLVLVSVVVAGIVARTFVGDYLYFGHPAVASPDFRLLHEVFIIAIAGGLLGGAFAWLLAHPERLPLPRNWVWRPVACGTICALIALATHGTTAGSGYEATRAGIESGDTTLLFPLAKLVATVVSYASGMAGGIFSPSLSIGAGVGLGLAKLLHLANFRSCALIGMVAFFTGVVQAPLTSVVIVMEMTDEHALILPFMVAAFVAQAAGRRLMPVPLYRFLAKRHTTG